MSDDARIDILKDALAENKLIPKAEKDALADDLEFAQTINGDPDPTRQMMKRMLISGVRREMLAYDRHATSRSDFERILGEAMREHAKNCPLGQKRADDGSSKIRIGKLFEASGDAAKIVAAVATVLLLMAGWVAWQGSQTREAIKQSMRAAVEEAAAVQK